MIPDSANRLKVIGRELGHDGRRVGLGASGGLSGRVTIWEGSLWPFPASRARHVVEVAGASTDITGKRPFRAPAAGTVCQSFGSTGDVVCALTMDDADGCAAERNLVQTHVQLL